MKHRITALIASACMVAVVLHGQPPAFEVASIKPNKSGTTAGTLNMAPERGSFVATNAVALTLVMTAYNMWADRITGFPAWLATERLDVEAKADHPVSRDEMLRMLQTLLADRFKLSVRSETKEIAIYALVVAKGGPKLRDANGGSNLGGRGPKGEILFRNISMPFFALGLAKGGVDRPIIDKTGLAGNYDFELLFTPESIRAPRREEEGPAVYPTDGPSIFSALEEQLGLKLEPQKGPIEFLNIVHVERPTEN
jgi:uncharacterized protein (TIGR03435 family)